MAQDSTKKDIKFLEKILKLRKNKEQLFGSYFAAYGSLPNTKISLFKFQKKYSLYTSMIYHLGGKWCFDFAALEKLHKRLKKQYKKDIIEIIIIIILLIAGVSILGFFVPWLILWM